MLAGEVFKLRRMRVTWVLMVILIAFEALMIGGMAYWAQSSPDAHKMTAEEREQAVAATSFPASVPSTLSFIASLGPLFAIILAARVAGDEYAWGTAKQQVSMGVDRRRYVASKLAGAAVASLFLLVGAVLAGAAISLVVTMALGRPVEIGMLTPPFLAEVARGAGIAWFTLGLYSVFTVCVATLARSSATATAIGILVLLLEGSVVGSLATRFATVARIAPYTIGYNVNVLLSLIERGGAGQTAAQAAAQQAAQAAQAAQAQAAALPPGTVRAFVVLGVWFAASVACSLWAFSRQELGME
ncbi:MAG: ABC transporter permease subunit [Bacillota bacterium]